MLKDRGVTHLSVGSLADPGIGRDYQEDNLGYFNAFESQAHWPWARWRGNLYVLADGVGGRASGEEASQLAVDTVLDEFYSIAATDLNNALRGAVQAANKSILQVASERGQLGQMRTTIVCAVLRGRDLLVVNAGDSRAYLVRGGKAEQLTTDHTLVAEWVIEGQLTPEGARHHARRHVVTQSLGAPEGVQLTSRWEELLTSDAVVLCSDGLYDVVSTQEIARIVSRNDDPQEACGHLVDLANRRSGPDNISTIVIRVDSVIPESETAGMPSEPLPARFGARPVLRSEHFEQTNMGSLSVTPNDLAFLL